MGGEKPARGRSEGKWEVTEVWERRLCHKERGGPWGEKAPPPRVQNGGPERAVLGWGAGKTRATWWLRSIVGLFLHPTPGVPAQDEFANLIIDEDEETVGEGTEPPAGLERVHAKGHIHAWAVGQEGSEGRFLKESEDQDLIPRGTGERLDLGIPTPGSPDPQRQRQTDTQTKMDMNGPQH